MGDGKELEFVLFLAEAVPQEEEWIPRFHK